VDAEAALAFRDSERMGDVQRELRRTTAGTPNNENYWHVRLTINGRVRNLRNHRIIWALAHGRWPKNEIDHKDRNPSSSKPTNLREATPSENNQNKGLQANNTSGAAGVKWSKQHGKWRAEINVDGRRIFIGLYDTFEHACQARIGAESVLHPFRSKPKPLDPAKIIPDGALVTGFYRFAGKPRMVVFTLMEPARGGAPVSRRDCQDRAPKRARRNRARGRHLPC
jgi:HNH endonuclease